MNDCPQCRQAIDGIAHLTYAVGWCEKDIHVGDCFALHVRVCAKCRLHNERLASEIKAA